MRSAWLVIALSLPGLAHAESAFEAVIAAEVQALSAEKAELTRSLEEAESGSRAAEARLRAEIEALTRRLTEARAENAARTERLTDAERAHSLEDQARRITQLTDQIQAWGATRGVATATAATIDGQVRAALELVGRQGSLHSKTEEFFAADGRAQRAEVLHIAQVAALVEGPPAIPLVRVDDGSLRAVAGLTAGSGAVDGGRVLSVVLFDPLEAHTPSSYADEGWLDWMRRGGAVMWPLALLGLIALLVALERGLALLRAGAHVRAFERRPRAPEARDVLLAPVGVVMQGAGPPDEVEARANDGLVRAEARLRRGISFLGIAAAASPLVGLLGTVTGMIRTFSVITEHGTGDPRLLSAGISEALLTTQFGLAIAVPALLLHSGLLRWAQQILRRIEELCVEAMAHRREAADDE